MGREAAKPQFPAAATATPNGPGATLGGAGTRVVIAVAEARIPGPVWAAVVHPGGRRLTEPTAATGDAEGDWGPTRATLLLAQPAAVQSRTTIAVNLAAPLNVTKFYASGVSLT